MSESKPLYSVEETLRIQTVKLNQQLNKLLEQNTQIIELTAERDSALAQNAELVAMVDALRMMIYNLVHACKNNSGHEPSLSVYYKAIDDAYAAWNATPTQHLRDRDAEVVSKFIEFMHRSSDCQLCEKSLEVASQYAEKVRRGEV